MTLNQGYLTTVESNKSNHHHQDYKSMIKNPLKVGAVRIYMDSDSKDTSFGGITADTFQGVATLITPKGPFKMEGAR
jgi:hypothetical protein